MTTVDTRVLAVTPDDARTAVRQIIREKVAEFGEGFTQDAITNAVLRDQRVLPIWWNAGTGTTGHIARMFVERGISEEVRGVLRRSVDANGIRRYLPVRANGGVANWYPFLGMTQAMLEESKQAARTLARSAQLSGEVYARFIEELAAAGTSARVADVYESVVAEMEAAS